MEMQTFIAKSGHADLAAAVIEWSGGWEEFQQIAEDVVNNGADRGFAGWIYYSETSKFAKANRDGIRNLLRECANNLGQTAIGLAMGFKYNDEFSEDEIADTIYGNANSEFSHYIENSLSWFALEQMAWSFVNIQEEC